jgi:regulator of sirC expression with transglutaminase-like and TPR domain
LNEVINRRTGIPITLSIVYMHLARSVGMRAEGVGMPGHFLVRVWPKEGGHSVLVDAFHSKSIGIEECQHRLNELFGGELTLQPEHLKASDERAILFRVLANLKALYVRSGLYRQALSVVDRMLIIDPCSPGEIRSRALLLAQTGDFNGAVEGLQAYLRLSPRAIDEKEVRDQISSFKRKQAEWN